VLENYCRTICTFCCNDHDNFLWYTNVGSYIDDPSVNRSRVMQEGSMEEKGTDLLLVVKVIGIAEGPVDGIEDGCGGDIKNGSSLLVSSSAPTKGLEPAWKREPVTAILMACSFEDKLGLVKGRSEDGFKDSCSDGIGDGFTA
jgi:hypothetical protein